MITVRSGTPLAQIGHRPTLCWSGSMTHWTAIDGAPRYLLQPPAQTFRLPDRLTTNSAASAGFLRVLSGEIQLQRTLRTSAEASTGLSSKGNTRTISGNSDFRILERVETLTKGRSHDETIGILAFSTRSSKILTRPAQQKCAIKIPLYPKNWRAAAAPGKFSARKHGPDLRADETLLRRRDAGRERRSYNDAPKGYGILRHRQSVSSLTLEVRTFGENTRPANRH